MRCVRVAVFSLLAMCWVGCGSSSDPIVPENPTSGPPDGGPTRDGLPKIEEMGAK
jgi:hypothetical protein